MQNKSVQYLKQQSNLDWLYCVLTGVWFGLLFYAFFCVDLI